MSQTRKRAHDAIPEGEAQRINVWQLPRASRSGPAPPVTAALPPTRLWGEGLRADGWADTQEGSGSWDGFLYVGWEYRSVTHLHSFAMLSFCTRRSKLRLPLSPIMHHHFVARVMNQKDKKRGKAFSSRWKEWIGFEFKFFQTQISAGKNATFVWLLLPPPPVEGFLLYI